MVHAPWPVVPVLLLACTTTPWAQTGPPAASAPTTRAGTRLAPIEPPAREPPREEVHCPGPGVEQVIDEVLRREGLSTAEPTSWRRRLFGAAFLPRLSARVNHSSTRGELLDIYPSTPDRLDLNSYLALRWEVHASWDLGRLVFDPRELALSRQARALARERRQLVEQVSRLYHERCRLLTMRAINHPPALDGAADRSRLELLRITAILDAFSGGLFTRSSKR